MKALLIGGPEDGRTIKCNSGLKVIKVPEGAGNNVDFFTKMKGAIYYKVLALPEIEVYTHASEWGDYKILSTLLRHYADTKKGREGTVACRHNWIDVSTSADKVPVFVCSVCGEQR